MADLKKNGRLLVAVTSAAALALAVIACEGQPAKSALSPSPLPVTAGNSKAGDNQLLAAIRQSTAKYHNIDAAFADGYVDDGYGCVDSTDFGLDPSVGGMGFHLINEQLHADPATDPLHPDLLVYEPARSAHGQPKLVALEYEVFRPDWYGAGNTQPPSLFGHPFAALDFDTIQVFELHIWLWLNNPSGMFNDFNPNTSCH